MRLRIALFVSLFTLIIPVALYIYQFGFGLWEDNADWANMGSYFGGVLGPLITSFSLLFLGYQIHLQVKDKRQESNDKLCSLFETDIMAFLPKLAGELSNIHFKEDLKSHLNEHKKLVEAGYRSDAETFIRSYISKQIRVHTMWVQIDASMRHLKERNDFRFRRMRAYILSECEVEDLAALDAVRTALPGASSSNCMFPEKT
jgi:hypothetical protein